MNTTARLGSAERFGRRLGRCWRAYARGEQRLSGKLVAKGLPTGIAVALLWAAKLTVLGGLLYAAFWLAVLVALAYAGALAAAAGHPAEEDEWPFTDLNELRKTPGYDPNLFNDTSHEMYKDD